MTLQPLCDHLYIELTDRCNLACRHCYLAAGPQGTRTLDGALVMQALEDFSILGGLSVALSGGEPLLHPDWRNLTRYAARLGLATTLVTNGWSLDANDIEFLLAGGTRIALSLDGVRAETHDAIRAPGSFCRVQQVLDRLVDLGAQDRCIVCYTPNHMNVGELYLVTRELAHRGFRHLYISSLEDRGREREHTTELGLTTEDRVRLLTQLALLLTEPRADLVLEMGHLQYFMARLLGQGDGWGDPIESTFRIAPDGRVYLTAYVEDDRFVLGYLNRERLFDVYASPSLAALYARARSRQVSLPGACAACQYRRVCGGGSPARAFAAHGTMASPDEFCEAKRIFLDSWYRSLV